MYYYKIYSFTIKVPFLINELIEIPLQKTDISITEGHVPNNLEDIVSEGNFFNNHILYQVNTNRSILLFIKDIGYYYITDKNTLVVQRLEGVSDEDITIYLLGFCFGFLISLHENFALHGSAVKINDESCVIFVGESGAGKSTTAAKFVTKGCKLIADDVCLITFDNKNQPLVHPAYPQIKLWEDSAENLNLEKTDLKTVSDNWKKLRVPVGNVFESQTIPLKAIYYLEPTRYDFFSIVELKGFEKVLTCTQNTYNRRATMLLNLEKTHFDFCTKIASKVKISKIERSQHLALIDEMIEQIQEDLGLFAPHTSNV